MTNFAYNSILHDLSFTPRPMSATETVAFWLGEAISCWNIFTKNVFRNVSNQRCNPMDWDIPGVSGSSWSSVDICWSIWPSPAPTVWLQHDGSNNFSLDWWVGRWSPHWTLLSNYIIIQICLDSPTIRRSFSLLIIYPYWIQKWRI